ncbi:MAG: hypothetical protein ACI9LG_003017 [Moritella dasanensis]|jgi:hypothetical protein
MKRIIFSLDEVLPIEAEAVAATEFTPTYDDIWDPTKFKGSKVVDEYGNTEVEALSKGLEFWPDVNQLNSKKIRPQLTLIAEHGIFIMNNVASDISPIERGTLAYAKGCHPEHDADFQASQDEIFDGEMGSITIPLEWVNRSVKAGKKQFIVELGDDDVRLIIK